MAPTPHARDRLADRLLAEADPIGQHVTFEFTPRRFEIVGIVGNEQFEDLDRPVLPVAYFAAPQDALRAATIMVRASQPGSWLITTTGGDAAVSDGPKLRPRTTGTRIVSK